MRRSSRFLLPHRADGFGLRLLLPLSGAYLLTVRTTLPALALVLAACGGGERQASPASSATASAAAPRGPDDLVLRLPRAGGVARVYAYPQLDTVVWSATAAPAPLRVLAFDAEAGSIAYVNASGTPTRLDFRHGIASTITRTVLTGVSSADGATIFGIAADGSVERHGASGVWRWKSRVPARAVFPQSDGTLLVLAQHGNGSVMWRLRPPGTRIIDSVVLSTVDRTLRTQVGDRLYLGSGSTLTGVRTRLMQRTADVQFDETIELLEATPSGDRVFVVTEKGTAVHVVDRYREAISGEIEIGHHATDLRVDALGRYLLARPEGTDSALVIALGTYRVVGTIATRWRDDLPFVSPEGGVAVAQGNDVVLVDAETLRPTTRVSGGAADFWYPFRWTGFRPRDARLDRPVEFAGPTPDSARPADSGTVVGDSSGAAAQPRDSVPKRSAGFTVSFAALLVADKARDLAAQIQVGNESARVVTSMRDGAAIYRVVMGPYPTREDAERIGRESKQSFWVYEGTP